MGQVPKSYNLIIPISMDLTAGDSDGNLKRRHSQAERVGLHPTPAVVAKDAAESTTETLIVAHRLGGW